MMQAVYCETCHDKLEFDLRTENVTHYQLKGTTFGNQYCHTCCSVTGINSHESLNVHFCSEYCLIEYVQKMDNK